MNWQSGLSSARWNRHFNFQLSVFDFSSLSPADKLKIRRATKRLHWFFQIAMIVALAAIPFERDLRGIIGQTFAQLRLIDVSGAVQDAFTQFYFERQRELVAFIPPTDPAARSAWARSVVEHIDQPAAVFLQQGGRIDWFSVPAVCREELPRVESLLRNPADSLWRKNRPDTLGAMLIRRAYIERDSAHSTAVWQLGPLGDSLRWGNVQGGERYPLGLRAFCNRLKRGELTTQLEPAVKRLDPWLSFARNEHPPHKTTMRVSIDGDEIYRSPSLDTTAVSYVSDVRGIKREFFLGDQDERWRANLAQSRANWRSLILPLLMMLTIFTLHRWILKLTEPEGS